MSVAPQFRLDADASSYRGYGQSNSYSHDLGVVVLPVAGRAPAHRVIRLHGGLAYRRVDWTATRAGRPPMIPAAQDTAGDTLLGTTVTPSLPTPNTQAGGYDWSVSGSYLYIQDDPRVAGVNALPVGEHPYAVLPAAAVAAAALGNVGAQYAAGVPRADAQTEFLSNNGYGPTKAGFVTWPLLMFPASYTSTHIIGG